MESNSVSTAAPSFTVLISILNSRLLMHGYNLRSPKNPYSGFNMMRQGMFEIYSAGTVNYISVLS